MTTHPSVAEEKHAGCNAQSSCTMTETCDYSGFTSGSYTTGLYTESGSRSKTRVSDTATATFVVNN